MHSTATNYLPFLTAPVAREHVNDLLRDAASSRAAAHLPARNTHRTPRRRPLWWVQVIARRATPRIA